MDKNSNNKLLASLAVFRSLDKEGKTINEILSEFLIDIIKSQHLHQFTASEISSLLDELYDFQIPDAVIRTALKKIDFVSVSHHQYAVSDITRLIEYNLEEKQSAMLDEYNKILDKLYIYIENKQKLSLSYDDRKKVEQAFTNFVLDNVIDNGFSDYISAFIIDNKDDQNFMTNLETMKEGVILYTGLKFNPHMSLNSAWKEKFTIYLNTEIIFHLAGYNGTLYQLLFKDFYNLVKEANKNFPYIQLKIFKETKQEIESFFYAAEKIIKGDSALTASSPAMRILVNGSKNSIDILAKKAQLFELLKTSGIIEEDNEVIYESKNYKFNLSEKAVIEKYERKTDERFTLDYIQDIYKKLNYISIKRAEREKNNFEYIGYILLTENSIINMVAWDEEIKSQGDVPLATNLQFITNKLWFKLNKGFGTGDYPVSFKVITKAQILLASHLSDRLHKEYKELQNNVKNGGMNESVALTVLFELRNRSKMPEELFNSDMTSVLATITEKKLDDYALKYENTVKKAKEGEKQNKILKQEIEIKIEEQNKIFEEKEELKKVLDNTNKIKEEEKNILLKQLIEEKEQNCFQRTNKKNIVDGKADKIFKREQLFGFITYISVLVYIAYYYIDWNSFEKWAWIATLILPVIILFFNEKIKILQEFIKNRKNTILNSLYLKHEININEVKRLSQEIEILKNDLNIEK